MGSNDINPELEPIGNLERKPFPSLWVKAKALRCVQYDNVHGCANRRNGVAAGTGRCAEFCPEESRRIEDVLSRMAR